MSATPTLDPVRMVIRFERFPAAVRGAFVMRGGDGDPHSCRFDWARLERVPDGVAKSIGTEDRIIDVIPTRDLFVPFEVPIIELEPAWYRVRCSVRVDGGRSFDFAGRPFTVPWPRGEVRKGSIPVGRSVRLSGVDVVVERVECGWDQSAVVWRPAPGPMQDAEATLLADGIALPVLPPEAGPKLPELRDPAEQRTLAYPVPRSCRTLAVVIRRLSGETSVEVPVLP